MQEGFTARAAANIALVKYWGATDLAHVIPCNASLSMTLDECASECFARAAPDALSDEILLYNGEALLPAEGEFHRRIAEHLDRLRDIFDCMTPLYIATRNRFPAAAGLASSASGFCALTAAVSHALGKPAAGANLSDLARRSGSGSASRSAFGGYVRWPAEDADIAAARDSDAALPAVPIADEEYWPLADVIAIVDANPKKISSLDGHRRAASSPHFRARLAEVPNRLLRVEAALAARDLDLLGATLEEDAIELHLVAMSSQPPIHYWRPGTIAALECVRSLRAGGISAWATMDAGPNVHVICRPEDAPTVAESLRALDPVRRVIEDKTGGAPCVYPGFPEGGWVI